MDVKARSGLFTVIVHDSTVISRTPRHLSLQYPLNPLQGFAICLATLDTKFTDLKLYDNVTKLIKRK